jgi:fibro-slime domain-containing protein
MRVWVRPAQDGYSANHRFDKMARLRTTDLVYRALLTSVFLLTACATDGIRLDVADGGSEVVDASQGGPDGPFVPPGVDAAASCGDGKVTAPETCDDGDSEPDDGCSASCQTEPNFACPQAGEDCVQIVTCGNGRIEGDETCDDADTDSGDGCSALCAREPGWSCPTAGTACVAAECGDGIVAGFEQCDDGDSGAGCVSCRLQPGFHCPTAGAPCVATTCGDKLAQGLEECDDGNAIVGDGCTPACLREPDCTDGVCARVCGDAVLQAGESCDDGNNFAGDGCSKDCQEEAGFTCVETPLPDPPSVTVYATVRDFIASCGTGSRLAKGQAGATAPFGHPDFECFNGERKGMVATDLDAQGKPKRVANDKTSSDASFAQWYRSDDTVNRTIPLAMTLGLIGGGAYRFDSDSFYPATGLGFDTVTCGSGNCERLHADGNGAGQKNFHFTSEVHFWFEYAGNEVLAFSGDDDVWVFINGKLAVDIGGVHGRQDGSVDLSQPAVRDALDLDVGGVYEAVVFQAERHTERSQYRLTLTNFNQTPSTCKDMCGDGAVSSREVCDEGTDNGSGDGSAYGGCAANCTLEPYCGDGVTDEEFGEICDDGLNLGGSASSCAPGCMTTGGVCGDGVVQTELGETCDDGNTSGGDGCSGTCQIQIG